MGNPVVDDKKPANVDFQLVVLLAERCSYVGRKTLSTDEVDASAPLAAKKIRP